MIDADRESYARQFEAAKKHLPRKHVINHCTWRDGQLSVMAGPVERPAKESTEAHPKVRRGAAQEDLFV